MAIDDIEGHLVKVFRTVFPDLPAEKIRSATQSSVADWESVAGTELMNVLEQTFAIVVDFDRAAELNSFAKILDYVKEKLEQSS